MPGIEGSIFARSSVKKFQFTSFACVKPTIELLPTAGNQKREYQMILILDQWREGALSSPEGMLEIRERLANANAYRLAQGRTVDRQLNELELTTVKDAFVGSCMEFSCVVVYIISASVMGD